MMIFLSLLLGLWLPCYATAVYITPATKDVSVDEKYDYIVVGAGIGGLVVATRLSEDPSVSVLVIESGELDDHSEDVTIPGLIGRGNSQRYQWNLTTVEQRHLDNKTRAFFQGRAVGGSTILNGLCWTRGSEANFNAWEALGNPGWGWDDMQPYFRKAEKISTKIDRNLQSVPLDAPGDLRPPFRGQVEIGFPEYLYNQSINFLNGMEELGVPYNEDPNGGNPVGCSVIPSSMTSEGQSREDPRNAYLDPVISRPNLHVLTGHTAARILHDNTTTVRGSNSSGLLVTGVEFATDDKAERRAVSCRKEVILAAGAIFSPVLLQVSGLGPRAVLERIGVPVVVDLPGVGRNLQDHPMIQPVYRFTGPGVFSAEDIVGDVRDKVREEYLMNRTGPWTAPMVNTVAFPSLQSVAEDWAQLLRGAERVTDHLPGSYDDEALYAGYAAQERQLLALLNCTDSPAYELMSTSWGQLAVSAMQPFSRGVVEARGPASVFPHNSAGDGDDEGGPLIDPRYCSHPFDCEVLVRGLEVNDRLVRTAPMAALGPVLPDEPGLREGEDDGDEDRDTLRRETVHRLVRTEFHPSGTAAMMPPDRGGVVDTSLRVHGARNLRVVDAAVIPLIPDGHIQAAVYAIAEKAADIIKRENPDAADEEFAA